MPVLRVLLDALVDPLPGDRSRYAQALTSALVATTPPGSGVLGIVPSASEEEYARIRRALPGLDLVKSALGRRELSAASARGLVPLPGRGLLHSPGLLAPLARHDRAQRPESQVVVTINDAVALTHPHLLRPRQARWRRAMIRRAERFADAVVVPTHAVAAVLDEETALGDRLRVIGVGVGVEADVEHGTTAARARRSIVVIADDGSMSGIGPVLAALRNPDLTGLSWEVVVSDPATVVEGEDVDASRIRTEPLRPSELREVAALVVPSGYQGAGMPILDAFANGVPVLFGASGSTAEVAAGAAVAVLSDDPTEWADAITAAVGDDGMDAERLRVAASDRARAFSWRDSAEKVWQLHADL